MYNRRSQQLFIIVLLFSLCNVAIAQNSHSLWSKKSLRLIDGSSGMTYTSFISANTAASWTDKTRYGYFHIIAIVSAEQKYEFTLVSIGSSDSANIYGLWDVRYNGTLVCNGCVGQAYGLNLAINNYFKVYIGDRNCNTQRWHYSGYVLNRFDF